MFHFASKILSFFIMPTGIICVLLVCAVLIKNQRKSKNTIIIALVLFYLFSIPITVNELLRLWEEPATPISTVKPHDIGIVLTGGAIVANQLPTENIFLGGASDRIGQTLQLYKYGKIKKIIISGGEVPIIGKTQTSEIEQIARYLIISGVPRENIYLEKHSTNTHENAVNVAKILTHQFPNGSYLLITSAFHMKRASDCFEKAGIHVNKFGSNYLSAERMWSIIAFVPGGEHMGHLHLLFREVIGYISYWIFGWI